jgi:hypothetical protein
MFNQCFFSKLHMWIAPIYEYIEAEMWSTYIGLNEGCGSADQTFFFLLLLMEDKGGRVIINLTCSSSSVRREAEPCFIRSTVYAASRLHQAPTTFMHQESDKAILTSSQLNPSPWNSPLYLDYSASSSLRATRAASGFSETNGILCSFSPVHSPTTKDFLN